MSEKQRMAEYLKLSKDAREHEAQMRYHADMLTSCNDRLLGLRDELFKTVQPNCGSAHLPSRRVYVDGQYTVLIVEWDAKTGRPSVSVQEPEK